MGFGGFYGGCGPFGGCGPCGASGYNNCNNYNNNCFNDGSNCAYDQNVYGANNCNVACRNREVYYERDNCYNNCAANCYGANTAGCANNYCCGNNNCGNCNSCGYNNGCGPYFGGGCFDGGCGPVGGCVDGGCGGPIGGCADGGCGGPIGIGAGFRGRGYGRGGIRPGGYKSYGTPAGRLYRGLGFNADKRSGQQWGGKKHGGWN